MKTIKRRVRPTFTLHGDLSQRAPEAATRLCLNTNTFINKCVEGCLEAAASDNMAFDIPIVRLMRRVSEQPYLEARKIEEVFLLHAPGPEVPNQHVCRAFVKLLEDHADPLTPTLVNLFWRLASIEVQRRLQYDKELAELKARQRSA